MKKRLLDRGLAAFALIVFTSVVAFGQGTTSRITGSVTDSTGAAVAGAAVTLTNEATNLRLTTTTSGSGTYVFDLIQPGFYKVSV